MSLQRRFSKGTRLRIRFIYAYIYTHLHMHWLTPGNSPLGKQLIFAFQTKSTLIIVFSSTWNSGELQLFIWNLWHCAFGN